MTISERILSELARFKSETGRPAESVYVGLNTWETLCKELGVSDKENSMMYDGLKVYRVYSKDHDSGEHFKVA